MKPLALFPFDHTPSFDPESAAQHKRNRLGVYYVLLGQNFGRKRFFSISGRHRHGGLFDDRAVIQLFVDQVYSATRKFHAVFNRLSLRVESREGRKQRGMYVQNAPLEFAREPWREQPHVAGKTDQVD